MTTPFLFVPTFSWPAAPFGQLYTYAAGGTTPKTTYSDAAGSTPNTNPVVLDANGTATVRLAAGGYHFLLKDSTGTTTIWDQDNYLPVDQSTIGAALYPQTSAEIAAGITPTNYYQQPGDSRRFTPPQNTVADTYSAVSTDFANRYLKRNATYTGGTIGNTLACFRVDSNISAGVANFEWNALFILNNSATAGENVALYAQGNKQSTGPTWGAVSEVRETSAVNDPAAGTIGLEVDVRSNGTDANSNRVGIDVVCTRYNTSGATTTTTWGIRIQSNGDGASSLITNAFSVWNCNVAFAFDCANATVSSGALRMASGQAILFDASGVNQLSYNGIGLDHKVSGTLKNRLLSTGGLQVSSNQVVGARDTGWSAMTGTPDKATAFATGSVTLAQLAGRVMSIQAALTTHGLLGA